MSKLQKRIEGMSQQEYEYHFRDQGDDPELSCSIFRLLVLGCRYLNGSITPREEKELGDNALFTREQIEIRLHRTAKGMGV